MATSKKPSGAGGKASDISNQSTAKAPAKGAARGTNASRAKSNAGSAGKSRNTAGAGDGAQRKGGRSSAAKSGSKTARGGTSAARKDSKGVVSTLLKKVGSFFSDSAPDAVEMLKNDHRLVDGLFSKVRENEDGNNRAVFRKIKTELDTHAHIEETVFYPYILERGKKDLKKIVREGIEEHRQVKMFLAELNGLKGTSEAFKAKLKVLMEDVDHHVKEEENEMFPMVRDQFSEQVLMKLAAELAAEKAKFKKLAAKKRTAPTAKGTRAGASA